MTWNPPLSEIICLLRCFCRILPSRELGTFSRRCMEEDPPNQPYPDFRLEHFQNLAVNVAFQQSEMFFQTSDGLCAAFRGSEKQRVIFWGIIRPWRCQSQDNMFDLGKKEVNLRFHFVMLLAVRRRTWFMSTSIPAFKPWATESSSTFSNRFFSLMTPFRKSPTSTCGV